MTAKALLQAAGDGTAVPVGYVLEVKEVTSTSAFNSGTVTDATSITLGAGSWVILGSCTSPSSNALTGLTCSISTTSATNDANNQVWTGAGSNNFVSASLSRFVTITTNTTYYLTGNTTGTGPATSQKNKLTCIRLA